jgi:hypothetical protein
MVDAFKYKDFVVLNSDLQRVSRKLIWKDSKNNNLKIVDNGIMGRVANKDQFILYIKIYVHPI